MVTSNLVPNWGHRATAVATEHTHLVFGTIQRDFLFLFVQRVPPFKTWTKWEQLTAYSWATVRLISIWLSHYGDRQTKETGTRNRSGAFMCVFVCVCVVAWCGRLSHEHGKWKWHEKMVTHRGTGHRSCHTFTIFSPSLSHSFAQSRSH